MRKSDERILTSRFRAYTAWRFQVPHVAPPALSWQTDRRGGAATFNEADSQLVMASENGFGSWDRSRGVYE
jgi:hypothetical protein